jgi:Mitochondrial carrier protein
LLVLVSQKIVLGLGALCCVLNEHLTFFFLAGAIVSHPADLILTKTSASIGKAKLSSDDANAAGKDLGPAWVSVVKDLVSQDGGFSNLFVGLGSRSIFFFLVIGLQFFLYDYVKGLFQVSSDDLSLVLDVFYAVRAGLVDTVNPTP